MARTHVRMCVTLEDTASIPVQQPLGWQLLRAPGAGFGEPKSR